VSSSAQGSRAVDSSSGFVGGCGTTYQQDLFEFELSLMLLLLLFLPLLLLL